MIHVCVKDQNGCVLKENIKHKRDIFSQHCIDSWTNFSTPCKNNNKNEET